MKVILQFLTAVYFGLLGSTGLEAQVPKPSPIQFVESTASAGINWSIKTLVPAKIYLRQGNSRTLRLNRDDLSFIGADNKPQVEPRDFDVIVGGWSQKFTLR
jgi:hypothetical protein